MHDLFQITFVQFLKVILYFIKVLTNILLSYHYYFITILIIDLFNHILYTCISLYTLITFEYHCSLISISIFIFIFIINHQHSSLFSILPILFSNYPIYYFFMIFHKHLIFFLLIIFYSFSINIHFKTFLFNHLTLLFFKLSIS